MTTISPALSPESFTDLTAQVAGPVLFPGDAAFEAEVAPFNLGHFPRPAVVVGATSAADVAAAVRWAAAHDLHVTVQSTGHGLLSDCEGDVLITTRRLDTVEIDPGSATARVGAGVRWVQVIQAAAPHGLAPLNGSSSSVGVIGYTLGGGLGVLARRYGFAADHVRRAQLVTADGEIHEVTAQSDPDLFWALRGGKGNFGIVTELEFGLVPVSRLYGGGIFYPAAAAEELLGAWVEWTGTLPEETTTSVAMLQLPPDPALPEPLRGQRVVHLRFAHQGSPEEGESLFAPMRAVADPLMDMVGEMPYVAVDSIHMDPPDPLPFFERGLTVRELPPAALAAFLGQVGPQVATPLLLAEIRLLGGAVSRPAAVPNAVVGRDGAFTVFAVGIAAGPGSEALPAALDGLQNAMAPWAAGGLLNFIGAADSDRVGRLWGTADRERLLAAKQRTDPHGLFRNGHQIG